LVLTYEGLADGVDADAILDTILERLPVPFARPSDGAFA
jgi:hypothetical protein